MSDKSSRRSIHVQGLPIAIEEIRGERYVSLTDLARSSQSDSKHLIISWLKNASTVLYLEAWETLHNPDFKVDRMVNFKLQTLENRNVITPQRWIEATGAIGLVSRSGRGGGTWAHSEIALNFCYWLSPPFQVYLFKEFERLKKQELQAQNLEWHIERITDLIDEARDWLDTVPGQRPDRQRLQKSE